MVPYRTEQLTATISADEYIRSFRDPEKFLELCRECPNYGRSWGCPPFGFDQEKYMRQWENVRLVAVKIIPDQPGLPLGSAQDFIRPERVRIERMQLAWERQMDGRSFAYVGKCLYCDSCTRPEGQPCRHPELVRPSLEAFGFDITKTLDRLFGIDLLWGADGCLPPYLTLVSAFFYNGDFIAE